MTHLVAQGIMAYTLDDKLVVGISSRALFDLDEADGVYRRDGLAAYREYQRAHEAEALRPGTGFRLVRALLRINRLSTKRLVEVIVMSRNDADSSMRIFNSAEVHGLDVTRGALTGGSDPWPYLKPFMASLFLSAEPADVVAARDRGFPAARVLSPPAGDPSADERGVRIAFDGDAVLFDDEAERVYQIEKYEGFVRHEVEHQDEPMKPGPLRPFLVALKRVQDSFPEGESPIRTALVTSRNAPAHKRVVSTFRAWGIHTDEAYFLGGIDKAGVLEVFRPDIFFDDQLTHLDTAGQRVSAAHVIPTYTQPPLFGEPDLPTADEGPRARPAPPRRRARKESNPPIVTGRAALTPGPAGRTVAAELPGRDEGARMRPTDEPITGAAVASVPRVGKD